MAPERRRFARGTAEYGE